MGSVKKMIEDAIPGIYVKSLMIGATVAEDTSNGFFMPINEQVLSPFFSSYYFDRLTMLVLKLLLMRSFKEASTPSDSHRDRSSSEPTCRGQVFF